MFCNILFKRLQSFLLVSTLYLRNRNRDRLQLFLLRSTLYLRDPNQDCPQLFFLRYTFLVFAESKYRLIQISLDAICFVFAESNYFSRVPAIILFTIDCLSICRIKIAIAFNYSCCDLRSTCIRNQNWDCLQLFLLRSTKYFRNRNRDCLLLFLLPSTLHLRHRNRDCLRLFRCDLVSSCDIEIEIVCNNSCCNLVSICAIEIEIIACKYSCRNLQLSFLRSRNRYCLQLFFWPSTYLVFAESKSRPCFNYAFRGILA